jgi:AcrR family transcriptional regulator
MAGPDKRREIMNAAEELFTSRRFHEITTDDIAHAASVGKGTIYRYFRDKEDLFFQTATSGFDELCDLVRRGAADSDSFNGQLLGACQQITGFFERRRPLIRMMHTEEGRMALTHGRVHAAWVAHREKLLAAVAEILKRGAAEGVLRRDLPPEVLASFLLGMLRTWARDLPSEDRGGQRLETVVDLFCRGAASSLEPAARRRT